MKQLTRFQIAACKRTAQNTKKLVSQKEKINSKMHDLAGELVEIQKQIDAWEEPIKVMTGGFTSEQVLAWSGIIPEESESSEPNVYIPSDNDDEGDAPAGSEI